MKKQEFLIKLAWRLARLPKEEVEERVGFYAEIIDDKMEEGLSEEEAIREIGTVDDIVDEIFAGFPLSKLVKERIIPKRAFKAWEIVLLVFALPILVSVVAAGFAIVVSLYASIWSVIVSVWAVAIALVLSFPACIISAILAIGAEGLPLLYVGIAILALGLSFFVFLGAKKLTVLTCVLTKKLILWVKYMFLRKENSNE